MDWLRDPAHRVKAAWIVLVICCIAWPVTSLTIFAREPQGVLALSWLAVIENSILLIATTDVRREQEE